MKRHLILVGLPGSGKTTVGRLLAADLEVEFVDIDALIVGQAGSTIERIFERRGERAFREMEQAAVSRVLQGPPCVVAPGGGWAAQPGALEAAVGSLIVYLETEPATAAVRVLAGGARPVLQGGDPLPRMERLFAARSSFYQRADVTVSTEGRSPPEIALELATLARFRPG